MNAEVKALVEAKAAFQRIADLNPPHNRDELSVAFDRAKAIAKAALVHIAALEALSAVPEDTERCIACAEPIVPGDYYYPDESGGCLHAGCCGPERESYTRNGEPLKPDDAIPKPSIWQTDEQFKAWRAPPAPKAGVAKSPCDGLGECLDRAYIEPLPAPKAEVEWRGVAGWCREKHATPEGWTVQAAIHEGFAAEIWCDRAEAGERTIAIVRDYHDALKIMAAIDPPAPKASEPGVETFIVDEDEGPPTGICIDLSDGSQIWTGEVADATFQADNEAADEFEIAGGNFLMLAKAGERVQILARVASTDRGILLARALASALANRPTGEV